MSEKARLTGKAKKGLDYLGGKLLALYATATGTSAARYALVGDGETHIEKVADTLEGTLPGSVVESIGTAIDIGLNADEILKGVDLLNQVLPEPSQLEKGIDYAQEGKDYAEALGVSVDTGNYSAKEILDQGISISYNNHSGFEQFYTDFRSLIDNMASDERLLTASLTLLAISLGIKGAQVIGNMWENKEAHLKNAREYAEALKEKIQTGAASAKAGVEAAMAKYTTK